MCGDPNCCCRELRRQGPDPAAQAASDPSADAPKAALASPAWWTRRVVGSSAGSEQKPGDGLYDASGRAVLLALARQHLQVGTERSDEFFGRIAGGR